MRWTRAIEVGGRCSAQCDTRRPTTSAARHTVVCHECCFTLGIICPEIRPHHSTVKWPSLVAHSTANRVPFLPVIAYRCQYGLGHHISRFSSVEYLTSNPDDDFYLRPRRHWWCRRRITWQSVTVHFRLRRAPAFTMSTSHCRPFSGTLKLSFLRNPLHTHSFRQLIVLLRVINVLFVSWPWSWYL